MVLAVCTRFQCETVVVLKHRRWSTNCTGYDSDILVVLVVLVQSAHGRICGSYPKFIGFARFILPNSESGRKRAEQTSKSAGSSQDKRKEAPTTREGTGDRWNKTAGTCTSPNGPPAGHAASRAVKTQVCIRSGWEDKHPSASSKWGRQTTDATASVSRSIKSMRQAASILCVRGCTCASPSSTHIHKHTLTHMQVCTRMYETFVCTERRDFTLQNSLSSGFMHIVLLHAEQEKEASARW